MDFDPHASNFFELQNVDHAEMLVTRYPDSANAYIVYVVYVLKQGDVAKARSIIRRALKSINFKYKRLFILLSKEFIKLICYNIFFKLCDYINYWDSFHCIECGIIINFLTC